MSKKITDLKIEIDGKEAKKSSKNYVKVKGSDVSVSTKAIEYYFDALDYKGEGSAVKDLKIGDKVLSFHYQGKCDSDPEESASDDDLDTKVKVTFNNEEDFKIVQKAFKKKE